LIFIGYFVKRGSLDRYFKLGDIADITVIENAYFLPFEEGRGTANQCKIPSGMVTLSSKPVFGWQYSPAPSKCGNFWEEIIDFLLALTN
jgi:hypothetical protein